jgi:hypothetical protein
MRRLAHFDGVCDCEAVLNLYPDWLPLPGSEPEPCLGFEHVNLAEPCRPGRRR